VTLTAPLPRTPLHKRTQRQPAERKAKEVVEVDPQDAESIKAGFGLRTDSNRERFVVLLVGNLDKMVTTERALEITYPNGGGNVGALEGVIRGTIKMISDNTSLKDQFELKRDKRAAVGLFRKEV
jgi:hypothetical protein